VIKRNVDCEKWNSILSSYLEKTIVAEIPKIIASHLEFYADTEI